MVAANPQSGSVWKKNGEYEIRPDHMWQKYRTTVYEENSFTLAFSLTILNLNYDDFGNYTCEALNMLGTDRETMTLYGK